MDDVTEKGGIRYLRPSSPTTDAHRRRLAGGCAGNLEHPGAESRRAVHAAWNAQMQAKDDVGPRAGRPSNWMEGTGKQGIVLAGGPIT